MSRVFSQRRRALGGSWTVVVYVHGWELLSGFVVKAIPGRQISQRPPLSSKVLRPGVHEPMFPGLGGTAGIPLVFIQPGKPVQNSFTESFNGRFRDECLNADWFDILGDARRKIGAWRQDYNQRRPHSALAYRPAQHRLT